jgi:hypothetical protein
MTASWATTPIGNLGFVDLESVEVRCFEARSISHSTIDIDDVAAFAADEVVVVVSDAVLVQRRGADRLNAPNETFVDEQAERVIDRLARDRSDVGFGGFGDVFGRAVGLVSDGAKYRKPLRGDVESVALQSF